MRLKLDKPLGTIYLSTEPHPIKNADAAPSEATRADEVAIETAKTSKVTAVVAVMNIFSEKRSKLRSANCGYEKPSCQKAESGESLEENSPGPRNLSQKLR
jgi:hypothetical protein